jgi:hypothetical protein
LQYSKKTRIMQVAFSLRRKSAQFFGTGSAIPKLRNQRVRRVCHSRKGRIVFNKLDSLAYARLSTATGHLAFLAVSPVKRS